ncbi:HSP20-like chaperone [Conidiobolus coronatus NRRL 28638]|uniref:HSP20-like chaperone n=1 Tax=Conidiobolus coronatus (strain ATCC 28846 / CBS 209.66 / NRRL 28638) TaxID=796925 RepID=A0A137PGA6_CONC2|nr:HSP20-like chaperone [Conidiobolus coronatus NRRL 28638]|eukprot:KXN74037.1 HSP20-like chaperone [Conidiobolus coronatus NRRL 28638]
MSLQQFHPFFNSDGTLDRFMNNSLGGFFDGRNRGLSSFGPRVDVYETEKETVVHAELPGFKPEDVTLDINENQLQISGESKRGEKYEQNHVKVSERSFGKFNRSIQLRNDSDFDNVTAKFNNGVLEVVIPKKANSASRRIQIS